MEFIHPQDQDNLTKMIGKEPNAEVLAEYQERIQFYHRGGGSGPLGPLGLTDLLRYMGYSPPSHKKMDGVTDWHAIQLRHPVEAYFFGQWIPGTFEGFVESGTLAIRLRDDPIVRECRRDIVRLAALDPYASQRAQDAPPPRAALLQEAPLVHPPKAKSKAKPKQNPRLEQLSSALDAEEPSAPHDPASEETPGAELLNSGTEPYPWDTASEGDVVWVSLDGDFHDGEYAGEYEQQGGVISRLKVRIKGEEESRFVPAAAVTYAG